MFGIWLIASSYALGFIDLGFAARNAWVTGICVLTLAAWALPAAMQARAQERGAGPGAGRRVS